MSSIDKLYGVFKTVGRVSTDTRLDVSGSIFFALNGGNFDGSKFINQALDNGALFAVTENRDFSGERIFNVDDVLGALQNLAANYREGFGIPIIAVGGSNGKTTTRELIHSVLSTKYRVHSSVGNLNNHIGVPLSILSMPKNSQIGLFEIGANHAGEHSMLLNILRPTHVLVTNNGLDHLEGFGSPEGVRMANKEIYDWAKSNSSIAFVNENYKDLLGDSSGLERVLYPKANLVMKNSTPLVIEYLGKEFKTNLVGDYNLDNIYSAVSLGEFFGISTESILDAVSIYQPELKRSQFVKNNGVNFILDCYNANPSSMRLSIESFRRSDLKNKGLILGDMLELGSYSELEHKKIVESLGGSDFSHLVFIGSEFKKVLSGINLIYQWFPSSEDARILFKTQDFSGFTFLLKGSRGIKVERVIE